MKISVEGHLRDVFAIELNALFALNEDNIVRFQREILMRENLLLFRD
jgi:hypothetical protein